MIQKLPLDMVSTPNVSSKSLIRVSQGRLTASEGSEDLPSEIVGGSFDDASGVLTLEFANGATVPIKGFPSIGNIPQGRPGPRGETGAAGKDGRDGRDGNPGEQGCEGRKGPDGEQGIPGPDGRPGLPGPDGRRGERGERGERGPRGPTGARGATGATGPDGNPGPTGPTGAPGPVGQMRIIVSTLDPGPVAEGTIWVNPNITATQTWPA